MSPNNGILLNGISRPKLLNIPLGSCSFINLDFLLLHTADFDNNIVVQFLVVNSFLKILTFSNTISLLLFLNQYYQYLFYNLNNTFS